MITHVITTEATEQDTEVVNELHQALAQKDVCPGVHFLDQGYSDSHLMIKAVQEYGIDMVMPMRTDHFWQARAGQGYALSDFHINWDAELVTCPQGKQSASWVQGHDKKGQLRFEVMFNTTDCDPCPARSLCTNSKRRRRKITIRSQNESQLIRDARAAPQTKEFQARYATRAGIEGTISQAVVALRMRRSRYRGLAKTHLQHIATAVGINIKRLDDWWNEVPFSQTKSSRFARLMAA